MISLSATDFSDLHRPLKCLLRVYLKHKGEPETASGPFEELLAKLGLRHEKAHLETLPSHVDLSHGSELVRLGKTKEEVGRRAAVIYHPLLRAVENIDGEECAIVGEPDFLLVQDDDYVIRDAKISRRVNEKDHPEILVQLRIYGWLYERTFARPPKRLEVYSGMGDMVPVVYDGEKSVLDEIQQILTGKLAARAPYSPVGWSKCNGCGYKPRCWADAEAAKDVALIPGIDQGLAIELRAKGTRNIKDLLENFDTDALGDLQRPWGIRMRRVGKGAAGILQRARAISEEKEILLGPISLRDSANYVMFDLEGIPPYLEAAGKIYLWGLQVFGEKPGPYLAAEAGFGEEGERQGWEAFLKNAKAIFDKYGDIPFVHWASYEKTHLNQYAERLGDPAGIAARVRANLLDLLTVTKNAVALPLPSYGLKVVEEYVGFKRKNEEASGQWAMARYIEAIETDDEEARLRLLDEIKKYNQEDLEATWVVLQWLIEKSRSA